MANRTAPKIKTAGPLAESDAVITENEIEAAVLWLRDQSRACAQARADRLYLEQHLKTVLACEAAKVEGAIQAREWAARRSEAYLVALEGWRAAVELDEKNRFLRESAVARIEAWRTMSSNERALGKVT
jgi:hypothetical protein